MKIITRMEELTFHGIKKPKRVKYLTGAEAKNLKAEIQENPAEITARRIIPDDGQKGIERAYYKIVDEIRDQIYYIAVPIYIAAAARYTPGQEVDIQLETFAHENVPETAHISLAGINPADYNEHIQDALRQYGVRDPEILDLIGQSCRIAINFEMGIFLEETDEEDLPSITVL